MRVVEGRSGSRLRLWIGVLVTVLMVAAFTPAVLNGSTMSAKSQTIPAGVSSKAVVLAGAGHFAPPHSDSGYDANGNGLFDFLLVNASVQITAPGNFTVYGTLHNANNTLQIYNSTSAGLPAGPANLTVWFDGRLINQSGIARRAAQPTEDGRSVYCRPAPLRQRHGLTARHEYTDDTGIQPSRLRSDTRLHDPASSRFRPGHEREWPLRLPERRRPGPGE